MKKFVFLFIAMFFILFAFGLKVQAKDLGYISVSSEVTKEVEPNFAQFSVSVENFNKNQEKAIQENNGIMIKIIDALKISTNDALKTTNLQVYPKYIWENNKQKFDTYCAKSTLLVSVDDISKVGELMTLAVKNGATSVSGLNFSLKSTTSYCNDILKQANLENIDKANAIASTMNKKVYRAKYINASCSQQTYYAQTNKMLMSVKCDAAESYSQAPVEKGTIKLYARVESEFYIK